MTVPHWRRSSSPRRVECDAVVVGAGIAGVSAALEFQRRGLSVRVVERCGLAAGASSRNAGFLMRGCADHYADATRLYGRERARALWKLTEDNLAALRSEGATALASFRETPSALLALDDAQAEALRSAAAMLAEDGFTAPWITRGADAAWRSGRVRGALINPGDASVNPWDLMRLLAGKLNTPVNESHEVDGVEPVGERVEVRTADTVFVAPRVLVCTNAYGPLLFPSLERLITARRGQMLALRFASPAAARLDASYYFNHGSEYFRQTPDGTIVFGGCRTYVAEREIGHDDRVTPWVQEPIERWAHDLLGHAGAFEITARWAGIMGFSPDGLPLTGPIPGVDTARQRIWFCGGFTGHGMSMGHLTARRTAAAMLGDGQTDFAIGRAQGAADASSTTGRS